MVVSGTGLLKSTLSQPLNGAYVDPEVKGTAVEPLASSFASVCGRYVTRRAFCVSFLLKIWKLRKERRSVCWRV